MACRVSVRLAGAALRELTGELLLSGLLPFDPHASEKLHSPLDRRG